MVTVTRGADAIGLVTNWRHVLWHFAFKIDTSRFSKLLAELIAQHAGLDHFDAAFGQIAELERAIGDADQTVHFETERAKNVLNFAVLAFTQTKNHPDVVALFAFERCCDRTVLDAVNSDAVLERIKLRLSDVAISTHAVATQPTGGWQLEDALEATVVGQQKQTFGVDVETANSEDARQTHAVERFEDRWATFWVLFGNNEAGRLVVEPNACALAGSEWQAIDFDLVAAGNVKGRGNDLLTVHRNTAIGNPAFSVTAGAEAGAGDDLG